MANAESDNTIYNRNHISEGFGHIRNRWREKAARFREATRRIIYGPPKQEPTTSGVISGFNETEKPIQPQGTHIDSELKSVDTIPSPDLAERAKVVEVRTFIEPTDLEHILRWVAHPEVSEHLVPAPQVPQDWNNPTEVAECKRQLWEYYHEHYRYPFVTVNKFGQPTGVTDALTRDDRWIRNQNNLRSPVINRTIIDPDLQHMGIGTILVATAIDYMFRRNRDYKSKDGNPVGPSKFYTWTMNVGQFYINVRFFSKLGFKVAGHYEDIAENLGEETPSEDAILWELKPRWWRRAKKLRDIPICDRIKEKENP